MSHGFPSKMFLYILLLHSFSFIVVTSSEDLHLVFGKKHCIDASLIPILVGKIQEMDTVNNELIDSSTSIQDLNTTKTVIEPEDNSLMLINDLAQYNKIKFNYELIKEEGPPHNKKYYLLLVLGDETYKAEGSSLKKAQKATARIALKETNYERPPRKLKENEQSLTPTVILNNIGIKLGIPVSYNLITEDLIKEYTSIENTNKRSYFQKLNDSIYNNHSGVANNLDEQITGPFTVRVRFGDYNFLGVGHTIQTAKHNAAYQAIQGIKKEVVKVDDCTIENNCKEKRDSLKSPISQIYEATQKRQMSLEFNVISETGPAHKRLFVIECRLGHLVSEAEGKSKKEAKKFAAEKMLERLWELPDEVSDATQIISGLQSKKKKKKIVKSNLDKLGNALSGILGSIWDSVDDSSGTPPKTTSSDKIVRRRLSPKGELLEVSNSLNIEIQFTDLSKKGDNYYTLLSLGVQPAQVCLGEGLTRGEASNQAALFGLKFLHKMKLLDKVWFSESKDDISFIEEFSTDGNQYLKEEDS